MCMVQCLKLKQLLPGLSKPPMPGELGTRIFDSISLQAWQLWLAQQTMLINEYRLNLLEPKSRQLLFDEMEKFLFQDVSVKPPGYVEQK